MAKNLKISGNFLIVSDTITRNDDFRLPRSNARYLYREDGLDKYFKFLPIAYMQDLIFPDSKNDVLFTDIIDDRTGLAFTSTDELKEFLDLNIGGDNEIILNNDEIYKARVYQSGTGALTIEEYRNVNDYTITSTKAINGVFDLSGFDSETFNTSGSKYEVFLNAQSIAFGESVLTLFSSDTKVKIQTYDSSDVLSNGILLETLGGLERYHILTIKKYN